MDTTRKPIRLLILSALVLMPSLMSLSDFVYPQPPRSDQVDELHGTRIPDPFRPLEQLEAPETLNWVKAEDDLLDRFVGGSPPSDAIRSRLTQLVAYDAFSPPQKGGRRYFFSKTPAGRTQNVALVYVADRPDAQGTLLLDVRARHGSEASLGIFAPSHDGRYLAYTVSQGGSAWSVLRILDVTSGESLADELDGIHRLSGRPEWTPDSRGLFYTTFDRPAHDDSRAAVGNQKLFYHWLRTKQSDDRSIALRTIVSTNRIISPRVTSDGRYAVISMQEGADQRTTVAYVDLADPGMAVVDLIPERDATFTFLGNDGPRLWFYTDLEAPRGRVIEIDLRNPRRLLWRSLVPEQPEAIAARDQTGGNALGAYANRIVLMYLRDGRPFLRTFTPAGKLEHTLELPTAGSVWGGFSGRHADPEVFFLFLGMSDPSTIYHLDVRTGRMGPIRRAEIPFDATRYIVEHDFYRSQDGTRIPIFIVHRKGFRRDGKSPALIYGYGALAWVSFIWYQPHLLTWLEMGGIYAQPAIRGGGEYGTAWHEAALRTRKQTAVDDYIAAAEWLIREGYTSPDKLVASGGSLSAPLAAAAIQQRPKVFGAAIIDRPVADLIRYENFTGAAFWTPEFGSVRNRDEFRALLAYSPYHRALEGDCLAPTLVMVGEHDQTAPPLHGYKLVAARQAARECSRPVFLKLMRGAGHDFGKTPSQMTDSFTAMLTFLARVLDVPAPQRVGKP
jgi:prolyl oligopeptidase